MRTLIHDFHCLVNVIGIKSASFLPFIFLVHLFYKQRGQGDMKRKLTEATQRWKGRMEQSKTNNKNKNHLSSPYCLPLPTASPNEFLKMILNIILIL